MKELKITRVKYDADLPEQFDYVELMHRETVEKDINNILAKGWEIQATHLTKNYFVFVFVRDTKLRLLENGIT